MVFHTHKFGLSTGFEGIVWCRRLKLMEKAQFKIVNRYNFKFHGIYKLKAHYWSRLIKYLFI